MIFQCLAGIFSCHKAYNTILAIVLSVFWAYLFEELALIDCKELPISNSLVTLNVFTRIYSTSVIINYIMLRIFLRSIKEDLVSYLRSHIFLEMTSSIRILWFRGFESL